VAAPTFGAEGTDGRAPATKVREDQERGAPTGDIASGACGARGQDVRRGATPPSPGSLPRRRRCGDPGHVAAADV
jgi:hypothetical protein